MKEETIREVYFVDTTFRDGHASLWAEGMTTGMMLPVASQMDQVGFKAMEVIATSHFKKCVRELREDPWERIRMLAQRITHTPLRLMMHCSVTAFDITPFSILRLWLERIAANGIKEVQLMEPSNDMSFRIPQVVQFAKEVGLKVVLALVYSLSPKHTDEYYAQKTRDAVKLKPDVLYLKDPGGLLTPEATSRIIPIILKNAGEIPVELHSHCTTGLAPLCYLEAIKLGIKIVHTAIPPLANGPSQPSVFNIVQNLRWLGYIPVIDEETVKPIAEHFLYIAKREGLPIGSPVEYEYYQYIHQVPGGVISNLKHQLSQLKMEHRLDEVLEEVVRVRQDLGYPIMVTPFSQFIVSQAAINVITGERYKYITDEIIQYTLGHWGKEAADNINPDIKDRILSHPRAKELMKWEPPEPSIEEVRQKLGGPNVSDEELLLRYMMGGEEEIKAMRAAGPIKEYPSARMPLLLLLEELTRRKDLTYIYIRAGNLNLVLQK